ncbi:hypothetical protein OH77DRAFT_1408283 [Trametes cingulata]|nr:hypothetical protein OH77DRAFT_1408283 [Trametes cingulata]
MSGGYGTKKSSMKKSGAHSHSQQPAPPHQPQAPTRGTSFHPSAATHMPSSRYGAHHATQDWGAPAAAGWDEPGSWGPPPPAKQPSAPPPSARPAWTTWANEARGLPMAQAQAQAQASHNPARHPSQQHHSRPQQPLHPSQQWQDPRFLAEQESILRSIQDARSTGRSHHSQQGRPQPVQQADSWGYMGGAGWGERASTIPEEDEYEDEDEDDEEDDWGDGMHHNKGYGWGTGQTTTGNGRVRFSPNVSYSSSPRQRSHSGSAHPSTAAQQQRHATQGNPQQFWTPMPAASKTMKMATGSISTTVFELAPPRSGMGEMGFVDSKGAALKPAERAMYNRDRPAKERFRWGFNPDKDPRVGSLLRWIAAMSNGLAAIGLRHFLETQERGALFANADFRVPSATPGLPPQPAFDYVTMDQIQRTLDATLQESVALYDPAFQVVVFVFLLSPSGNSMALWRRKLNIPDSVREEYQDDIRAVKAGLQNYPVYVDEDRLPVKPDAAAPKKKVRFAFLRRLFGGKKSTAAS